MGVAQGDGAAAVVEVRVCSDECSAAVCMAVFLLLTAVVCWCLTCPTSHDASIGRLRRVACARSHLTCIPSSLILQINSETDFVARNDQFRSLVSSAAAAALGVTALRPGGGAELEEAALQAAQTADGTR